MAFSRLVAGLAAATLFAFTGQAFAHAHLAAASPSSGSTVSAAPSEIDLTFTEGVDLKFTGITVSGPGGAKVDVGPATLKAGSDTVLIVPVGQKLSAGTYTVSWHALSTDGHKTKGTFTFTIKS